MLTIIHGADFHLDAPFAALPAEKAREPRGGQRELLKRPGDLAEERRALRCRVISHPSLMFECSNPYAGEVRFDGDGLPVSPRPGHGIGSHSIAAFCRKHGASYQYTAENGQFTLRVIL